MGDHGAPQGHAGFEAQGIHGSSGRNGRGGGGLSRQIASRDGGTRSGGFAQSKTRMRLVGGFKC